MKIRTLVKKGADHLVYCEDDFYYQHLDETLCIAGVFDGCSTGYKSHFASALYARILKYCIQQHKTTLLAFETNEQIAEFLFLTFFNKTKELILTLQIGDIELLSTFIIGIVKNNTALVLVSGDGCIMVDGVETKIESEKNAPDYLAYHISEDVFSVYKNNIKQFSFNSIQSGISLCSDGIYSFKKANTDNAEQQVVDALLKDEKFLQSEAMLARKYNLLTKDGFCNFDDISIIRMFF